MNISVQNLSKTYSTGKTALQNISLDIESPSFIGLLGPNGAGKSTFMNLLTAGILPSQGNILLDGQPLLHKEKNLKRRLGYLPQSFGLYDELTVWEFLDYMAALKGIRNSKRDIERVIQETNLTEKRKVRIRTLSGGQRQRVGIAQALLGKPELLIFDEPTVGLDPEERISFRNLFSQNAQNKIVLLSTHIIEDAQSVCNRLIAINHGRILFDGTPEQLILQARGHVGLLKNPPEMQGVKVTAQANTADGVHYRIVSEQLPYGAQMTEPTLEDAYMYLIGREGGKQ
ncbi:ABC transporter ATP-binding protein [Lactovum odontotermitis]